MASLKTKTAHTLKWTIIDRVLQQLLYAATGIVLARMLSQTDFGLVGAVLVFQAFASLLVDSGFSFALIQRKEPTQTDYSSVLWFNIGIASALYIILWFAAPLIAMCFQNDARLIPLSRVMFISVILNASAIVQTNRMMKQMDVRPITLSNATGLAAGAVAGIWLAVAGYGAWAIVWQTLVTAAVKSGILWTCCKWRPSAVFSWQALRSFFAVGARMMLTSFLNTLFLNLYSLFIGAFVGLRSLGFYTQSDKWSKMGIMSISQTLTSSFLPPLSAVQDDPVRFRRMTSRMNRFTAYILFPATLGLAAMATPLFHLLFGTKWDPSIILFQLLLIRGIFTVLNALYNNYLLALGHARCIMWLEVLRDAVAVIALAVTFPYMGMTMPHNPVYGLTVLLWGQLAASAITYVATLVAVCRLLQVKPWHYLLDLAPYAALSATIVPLMLWIASAISSPLLILLAQSAAALVLYAGINHLLGSRIQKDIVAFARGKASFE